jgi:tungstate transport system ATP-binding protein
MSAPLLAVRDLRLVRGGAPVLDVPTLGLHEREFVALIGPNGAGKTTLLLSMLRLLDGASGAVLFRGREVANGADALAFRRRAAMMLQEPLLFDTTVFENVASGLRLRGIGRREAREKVLSCLERFGLAEMAGRAARRLSAGEARRVSLARAVVVDPDVLFLDEPFANLDAPTREAITEDMRAAVRAAGIATILVTHDAVEALRLSDRIVVMQGGRVVQDDAPSVVLNEPVNAFVAAFVGMETIVEGVVARSHDGELAVSVRGGTMEALGAAAAGERVYCCVRPESVLLETADPGGRTSARNVFAAKVLAISSAGAQVKVTLDCGFRLVACITPESFTGLALALGKPLFASVKATAVHVIRRDTPLA